MEKEMKFRLFAYTEGEDAKLSRQILHWMLEDMDAEQLSQMMQCAEKVKKVQLYISSMPKSDNWRLMTVMQRPKRSLKEIIAQKNSDDMDCDYDIDYDDIDFDDEDTKDDKDTAK